MAQHLTLTRKQVIRYVLLPEIWPRLKFFFGSGFHHLAFLIAMVFQTVRILPPGHPYTLQKGFGQYGILQVLRQAWHSIEPSRHNIDQIIVFFTIIAGLIMTVIQFILMLIAVLVTPAKAAEMPTTYSGFFGTPNPTEDLAFRMLDMIFGVPGIFNSKELAEGSPATPFHSGLHALLEFYSYGLLAVGILILLYFVVVVVAETAQSGTPFGKRFNHTWAPLRIVLFFALLIPISNGLNGGQYLTLGVAKAGSGLATNGWLTFANTLAGETPLGEADELIYVPQRPDIETLPAFIMLAHTCALAHASIQDLEEDQEIKAYVVSRAGSDSKELGDTDFQSAAEMGQGGNVFIRFGVKDEQFANQTGSVYPYCGELVLYTSDISQPGSALIQQSYYDLVSCLWEGNGGTTSCQDQQLDKMGEYFAAQALNFETDENTPRPSDRIRITNHLNGVLDKIIADAIEKQAEEGSWELTDPVKDLGWVGAAIWYNKIAEQNGALVDALRMIPAIVQMPVVMQKVAEEKQKKETFLLDAVRFDPQTAAGESVESLTASELVIAKALNNAYLFWTLEIIKESGAQAKRAPTGNIIIDLVNLLLGTSGLFDMCKNTDIHPMAQLSGVGKGLIDSAISGMFGAALAGGLGAANSLTGLLSPLLTQASFAAASFMATFAAVGLMVGFILYYMLPMMPFIYFFFAVSGWIKCVFEAMVGVPLWALAHIRIDGDGLPGSAANAGYFMLLEVLIRPLMIVLGLLAAIGIFSAMVKVLNDIFYLVLANLGGHEPNQSVCFTDANAAAASSGGTPEGESNEFVSLARGPVDEFFFTVVYAIIVYLIGMACFKLIDGIPNNIMRWFGESVDAFNDNRGDPAAGLMQQVAIGGAGIGSKLGGGMGSVGSAFGNILK